MNELPIIDCIALGKMVAQIEVDLDLLRYTWVLRNTLRHRGRGRQLLLAHVRMSLGRISIFKTVYFRHLNITYDICGSPPGGKDG